MLHISSNIENTVHCSLVLVREDRVITIEVMKN